MRKIFFLLSVVLLKCSLAYASETFVLGANQIGALLDRIEQGTGDVPPSTPRTSDGNVDTRYDRFSEHSWDKIDSMIFIDIDLHTAIMWLALKAVNFAGKGYKQKEGTVISLIQPDLFPYHDEVSATFTGFGDYVDRHDISWLKTLDLSGNDFSDLVIDGGLYREFDLETVDLSNNPNLKNLIIVNCANLKVVNLTGTGLSQQDVDFITLNVHKYSPDAEIIYVPASDKKIGISSLVVYVRDNTVYIENKAPEAIVELYDLFGRKLMESQEIFFNISSLAKGAYLVKVGGKTTQIVK